MHLIRTTSFELEEFDSGSIPCYAILSHRWTSEEMSFQDMKSNRSTRSLGYEKVRQFCKRAAQDGFKYAWVDTCCIDKESSAELSEAINSMFIWYQQSGICYAYLEDVSPSHDTEELLANFGGSEWFKRGWTLQELIAPPDILFLASDWTDIKWKSALCPLIHDITGIDEGMLRGTSQPQEFSIARRMSWAAGRKTSRVEDMAYCLMGLFDVNMPLLYGEGGKAFIRFQEEIMKDSDDQSLFLWEPNNSVPHMVPRGLLAQSPAEFKESADMLPYHFSKASTPFAATNRGIRLHLPLIKHADGGCTMICECQADSQLGLQLVGIKMQSIPDRDSQFFRISHPLIRDISVNALHGAVLETIYVIKDCTGITDPSSVAYGSSTSTVSEKTEKSTTKGIPCPKVEPKDHHMQLVLSFDDSENDSNIIKLHHMLHRQDSSQAHHYSSGTYATDTNVLKAYVIGAYKVSRNSLNSRPINQS